jgi:uncharacterized membrane protein YsdA (DUF1294 family)
VPAADSRELIEIDEILLFIVLYLCVNLIAAWSFAWDKHTAKNNTWRTGESTLLVLSFLGPFGASGAMRLFRHKTRKMKFSLVPLFLAIHLVVIAYLFLTYR